MCFHIEETLFIRAIYVRSDVIMYQGIYLCEAVSYV